MVWQRRHNEVLDPAMIPWAAVRVEGLADGLAARVLSVDEADGAVTAQVRIPAGWRQDGPWAAGTAFDLFVLEGGFTLGEQPFRAQSYTYRPAGYPNEAVRCEGGALVMLFTYGAFALAAPDEGQVSNPKAIPFLQTEDVPAKQPLTDKVGLGYYSRTLRLDPDSGERLFVTGTERANIGDPRIEWHPCVEEIYRVSGDVSMDAPDDTVILAEGTYCYRPPGIPHGPFMCPQAGGSSLIRVDLTLVNNYVPLPEAKRMWRDYPREALDPIVAARIDR